MSKQFTTKDSGQRKNYASGMTKEADEDKARYDLIPPEMLKRLAELYSRGAKKYSANNWLKANSEEELDRFLASAFRHFMQWRMGETDEDHAIGAVWNIFAYETIKEKLKQNT